MKEKFEYVWGIRLYFVWMAVSYASFWVTVGYVGWVSADGGI